MDARYDTFKVWQALRQTRELVLEGWIIHEVINSIEAVFSFVSWRLASSLTKAKITNRSLMALTSRNGTHSHILNNRLPAMGHKAGLGLGSPLTKNNEPEGVMQLASNFNKLPSSVPSLFRRI
jgi:hypothetical protein